MTGTFLLYGLNLLVLLAIFLYARHRLNRELSSKRLLDEVHAEVNEMIVELNQTTERNIALIEERISRLNRVLSTADNRIGVLERGLEVKDSIREYGEIGKRAVRIAPETKGGLDSGEVIRLYRQGIDTRLIATRLGGSVGEVELIISLDGRMQ